MKKNRLKNMFILLLLVLLLILPYFVFAMEIQSPLGRLQNVASDQGPFAAANATSAATIAGLVVRGALSILGVIFIVLIIIAGYQLMNAGGNEEQISKAKVRIRSAFIGLLIVLGSYAIWAFIASRLIS